MNAVALSIIVRLREAGATLECSDGGRVRFSAPTPIPAALLAEARSHRDAIAEALAGAAPQAPEPVVAGASGSFASDESRTALEPLRRTGGLADGIRASAIGAFVRGRCIIGPAYGVECDKLHTAWVEWCAEQPHAKPGTVQTFDRDLRTAVAGLDVIQARDLNSGEQVRYYRGVELDIQAALTVDTPKASGTGRVIDAWGFTPAERAAALARLRPQPSEAVDMAPTGTALPARSDTASESVTAWAESVAANALDGYEAQEPLPDWTTGEADRLDVLNRKIANGYLRAALQRPPSWADPAALPSPGCFCSCCKGKRWWCERQAPKGWRCWTCHPAAHLPAGAMTEVMT